MLALRVHAKKSRGMVHRLIPATPISPQEDPAIPVDEQTDTDISCDARDARQCIMPVTACFELAAECAGELPEKYRCNEAALAGDTILVERIRGRDEKALATFYDRHASSMYALLLRILKDSGTAEEVLQDLFLEVWRRAGRFDASRGSPLAWLLVMGRSRALSRLRRMKRRETTETQEELPFERAAGAADPESEIARRRLQEKLRAALHRLPPKQKEAVELAYFEGMTQTEIAVRTKSPLGTVKSRVRVALQTLKTLFDGEIAF
ncbi:MAG: sigma-70 family RNA polymerase sigma factor [Acidobacteriaceae bacterium]